MLIGISSFLPSGFIFGFPLRHLLFLLALFFLFIALMKSEIKILKSFRVMFYYYLMGILILFLLVSAFKDVDFKYILEDFKFIFVTFMFFVLLELARYINNLRYSELYHLVFKWAFYGVFLFCISKVILVFSLLFNVIDYPFVENVIFPIINYKPVGLDIEIIGSRFSFVTLDFLSVIVFLYLIFDKTLNINKISKNLFYFIFLISLFSAYSRFLFAIVPVMSFIVLILNKKYKAIITISVILSILILLNIDLITNIFENRFLNQEHSDNHRNDMIHNLTTYWSESFIFGHGYGSYVPWYIRSSEIPFTYEVQLLSIIMRFGIFPILLLLWFELILFIYILKFKSKNILFAFLLFNILLIGSMTNQYLFNSTTNVSLLLIYLIVMTRIEVKYNVNN